MTKSPHVEIYRGLYEGAKWARGWRWRFRSSNGKILSQSSESYSDPRDLVRGLELSHPGYEMRDAFGYLEGYGEWYLWSKDAPPHEVGPIPVRVPPGTVRLWRARRKR